MTTNERRAAERAARQIFGWDRLRQGQREAIEAVAAGRDTLAVMPTGYGKSAIYQVAGQLLDGPTIVVSPLIALQKDQVEGIDTRTEDEHGTNAVAINSSGSAGATRKNWQQIEKGEAEYIFLAPEQLAKDEVTDRLAKLDIRLFVVDEAHCVSSWGHDFRPDYLLLAQIVERLGHPTVLAMTATGAGPVRDEIVARLGMRDPLVLSRGFDRPNLRLEVVHHADARSKRNAVIDQIGELSYPGLLYVATRKETNAYADALADRGLRVAPYSAGLRDAERHRIHEAFLAGELDVVAATNAFGMGIDKPDVRFVLHADIPESLDSYYQEIGRAGRDGEPALATLHYRAEDLGLQSFFASGIPKVDDLQRAAAAVPADGRISRSELAESLGQSTRRTGRYVNALLDGGGLTDTKGKLSLTSGVTAESAAQDAVVRAEERQRIERSRVAMMRQYAETTGCRRQALLNYFGDGMDEPCGNCDRCSAGAAAARVSQAVSGGSDAEFPPHSRVEHRQWGTGTVMSTEEDRITVFFGSEGYKVLSIEAIRESGVLSGPDQ